MADAGPQPPGTLSEVPDAADPLDYLDGALREQNLLAMQQMQGNQFVQRVLAPHVAAPAMAVQRNGNPPAAAVAPAPPQPALSQDAIDRKADEVYSALNWLNEAPRLLNALRGNSPSTSRQIESAFQRRHNQSMRAYLRSQLWGERETLVRAFALLYSTNEHEPHTAMGLALIPVGTRDAEVWRLLFGRPVGARRELETRYNEAFREIGTGSLASDLRDDLSGWAEEKAIRLLYRDLSSAEELYFDSVAIAGTHSAAVVSRIQREWAQGPGRFAAFEQEWNQYVRTVPAGAPGYNERAWTGMTLRQALTSEMSWEGESWELVRAVLDGYDRSQRPPAGEAPAAGEPRGAPPEELQRFRAEEVRRTVARDALRAATTGGWTGIGTNNEQVYQQVRIIREIWQARIARMRALQPPNADMVQRYESGWNSEREELRGIIGSEMSEGTIENLRSQLLLAGNLTPADEVWLATRDVDWDKVAQLATQYWATNRIDELVRGATESRRDEQNRIVRPSFNLMVAAGVTSGLPRERLWAVIADRSQAQRGARRLRIEIDEGDNDSDLRKAYDLLTLEGISAQLREATIGAFAAGIPNEEGATPVQKFLHYIARRYNNSNTVWQFTNLLAPSTDPRELLRRAEGQYAAANTGVLNALLNDVVRDYDTLTGEASQDVTRESIERLRFIAQNFQAHPEELDGMLAMTGARDVRALAQMEFSQFQSRLEELRAIKQSIADAIATAIEVAVAAALTAATGGVAGGALITSLGSALAGMLAREALLGQDYDLISAQNAQALAVAVASFGFGEMGQSAINNIVSPERLRQMGRAANFMAGAAREASAQVGAQITTSAFEGRLPSGNEIIARAVAVVGSTTGSGTQGALQRRLRDSTPLAERLRINVMANVANRVIGGTGEEAGNLVREGTAQFSGAEIALRFGRRTAQSISRGVVEGTGETGGNIVGARREARREAALAGEPETLPAAPATGAEEAAPAAESPRPPAPAHALGTDEGALPAAGAGGAHPTEEGEPGAAPGARRAAVTEGEPQPEGEGSTTTRSGGGGYEGRTPPPVPIGGGLNAPIGRAVADEVHGQTLVRRLVAGDASALREIGVTPPEGYSPRGREWGLGRTPEGQYVVVQGGTGGVDWSLPALRGLAPMSHTHPWYEGRAMESAGHTVAELLAQGGPGRIAMDLIRVMPSAEDIGFCAARGIGDHEVHTPYVHLGGNRVGNPDPNLPLPTVSFHIARAEGVGFVDINPVSRANVVAVDSAGTVIWAGTLYAYSVMGRVPFLLTEAPSHMTTRDERGNLPPGYRGPEGAAPAGGGPEATGAGRVALPQEAEAMEPAAIARPPAAAGGGGTPRATGNSLADALVEMRASSSPVDQNTARLVTTGVIRVRPFSEFPIEWNSVDLVRAMGRDPAEFVVRRDTQTGQTFMVSRTAEGTVLGNTIIINPAGGAESIKTIVRHEAYHALRGDMMSTRVPGSVARFRDEFTAYWIDGSFDHISDAAARAQAIREHLLRAYPDLRSAYDHDPAFRQAADRTSGPERNVLNSPRWHMVEQQLMGDTEPDIVLAALEGMPAAERIEARNDARLRTMLRIKLNERDYRRALGILNET